MVENGFFYPVAVIAILVIGISKSGFGGGVGVLAVPLMSLFIPPQQAAAILLPLLIVMDWFTTWHYRKSWDKRNIKILLPAAMLGILLGSLFFKYLSEAHIRILIGVIAVLFVALFFLKKKSVKPHQADIPRGLFWGAIAGFTSFGVHAGGPPINIYVLPQQLDKSIFVGTTVIFFTVVNLVKVIPYTLLGQFSVDNMLVSLVLAPVAPLGVWLGVKLHHRVNETIFYASCYIFLFITGIKLLVDGISGL
jgi:uncharacterized protein